MRTLRHPTTLLAIVSLGIGVACGGSGENASAAGARDSAGVTIVTSAAPRVNGTDAWTVDTVPTIVIADDGTPATRAAVFGRIGGAARTKDGGIVVLDPTAFELRYFDAQGRFVRSAGRQGEGPGEFQIPHELLRVDDGYLVTDHTGTNAVYDDEGRYVRSARIPVTAPFTALANGTLVAEGGFATGEDMFVAAMVIEPTKTITVDSMVLTSYGRDGVRRDTIGRFPVALSAGDRVRFTPAGLHAGAGNRLYSAFGDRAEVVAREDGRQVVTIARWNVPAAAVSPRERDELRRISLISYSGEPYAGEEHKARIAEIDGWVIADSLPRIAELRADTEGNLWVRRYQPADGLPHRWVRQPRAPEKWDVLNASGEWVVTVTTPANVRVLEVGSDYVIGAASDDDGVESVRLYPLRRGGR